MRRLLLACVLAATSAATASADNWPQWRGPKNDGHSAEKNLPTEWGAEVKFVEKDVNGKKQKVADGFVGKPKNVVWACPLPGRGSSTPAIWGDRMFLTAQDKKDVFLICIGTDGKEKWKKQVATSQKESYRGSEGDDASASCTTDGKHVWTFVGTGDLFCHDSDGKEVWKEDLQKYGKFGIQFGCHWTPVVFGDNVYLQVMHRNAQLVVALKKDTGKQVWKVERKGYGKGESPDTYASAFMWEGEGGPLLIAHGNDYCTAHKLEDGAEVWRVNGLNPTNNGAWRFVSSPLVTPNLIVVPSCKNGPTVALNPVGAKGTIDEENKAELWRFKSTPDVVSPLLVDGIVYLLRDGPLTAVDAKTGAQIYQADVAKQIHRGHMVAADSKIYALGREGAVDVIQAGKEFKKLATNTLPDTFYASPAIADGRIYLRGWGHLWAIGTK